MKQVTVVNRGSGPVVLAGRYLGPGETANVHRAFYDQAAATPGAALVIIGGETANSPAELPADGVERTVELQAGNIPEGEQVGGFVEEPAESVEQEQQQDGPEPQQSGKPTRGRRPGSGRRSNP